MRVFNTGIFFQASPATCTGTIAAKNKTFALVLSLPIVEVWFTFPIPIPGTPLFTRVADLTSWDDGDVSNQVKFVFPSAFDERWLNRRINETMEAFRKKKGMGRFRKRDRQNMNAKQGLSFVLSVLFLKRK